MATKSKKTSQRLCKAAKQRKRERFQQMSSRQKRKFNRNKKRSIRNKRLKNQIKGCPSDNIVYGFYADDIFQFLTYLFIIILLLLLLYLALSTTVRDILAL